MRVNPSDDRAVASVDPMFILLGVILLVLFIGIGYLFVAPSP